MSRLRINMGKKTKKEVSGTSRIHGIKQMDWNGRIIHGFVKGNSNIKGLVYTTGGLFIMVGKKIV